MSESWWKQRTTEKHPQRHLPFALQSPLHLSPPHPGLCGADLCECYQCASLLIGCQFCKYRHWQQSGGVEEREVQVSVPAALILSAMFRCFRCAGLFTYLIYSWVFYPFSCYCKWNCFLNFICNWLLVCKNILYFCVFILHPTSVYPFGEIKTLICGFKKDKQN